MREKTHYYYYYYINSKKKKSNINNNLNVDTMIIVRDTDNEFKGEGIKKVNVQYGYHLTSIHSRTSII